MFCCWHPAILFWKSVTSCALWNYCPSRPWIHSISFGRSPLYHPPGQVCKPPTLVSSRTKSAQKLSGSPGPCRISPKMRRWRWALVCMPSWSKTLDGFSGSGCELQSASSVSAKVRSQTMCFGRRGLRCAAPAPDRGEEGPWLEPGGTCFNSRFHRSTVPEPTGHS